MTEPAYSYKATIVRWVDGDTVWLAVDLGFRVTTTTDFRLYGCDTPERGARNFKKATEFARALAPIGAEVLINSYKPDKLTQQSIKTDKYGRWLVNIFPLGHEKSVSEQLVEAKLALSYLGGTRVSA